jgi:hypothetical protein
MVWPNADSNLFVALQGNQDQDQVEDCVTLQGKRDQGFVANR